MATIEEHERGIKKYRTQIFVKYFSISTLSLSLIFLMIGFGIAVSPQTYGYNTQRIGFWLNYGIPQTYYYGWLANLMIILGCTCIVLICVTFYLDFFKLQTSLLKHSGYISGFSIICGIIITLFVGAMPSVKEGVYWMYQIKDVKNEIYTYGVAAYIIFGFQCTFFSCSLFCYVLHIYKLIVGKSLLDRQKEN